MPAFLLALIGGLISAMGTLVGRVLVSLGIGYVTYSGLNASLDWLRAQIAGSFAGFSADAMSVLSALQVGAGVSVVLSALAARLVVSGLTSDTVKKMVVK